MFDFGELADSPIVGAFGLPLLECDGRNLTEGMLVEEDDCGIASMWCVTKLTDSRMRAAARLVLVGEVNGERVWRPIEESAEYWVVVE